MHVEHCKTGEDSEEGRDPEKREDDESDRNDEADIDLKDGRSGMIYRWLSWSFLYGTLRFQIFIITRNSHKLLES